MKQRIKAPGFTLPGIKDVTRRDFLVGGAAALLLGGCGSGGNEGNSEESARTRTVETPRGSVEIPVEPERIIAAYTHDLANALALGLSVIAGPGETGQPDASFPKYLMDMFGGELENIERIAYQPELNFEQLASLQPDVILSGMFGNYDVGYDRMEEIAPTVTYRYSEGETFSLIPWREVLRQNGTQFAREEAAEEFISRFEERATELRSRLEADWSGMTYAMVEPYEDQVYIYGAEGGHTAKTLTKNLGFTLANSVNELLADAGEMAQGGAGISLERVGEIDADIIFIPVSANPDGTPNRTGIDALSGRPIWSTLPAVEAEQVYEFTGDIWFEPGPMAMAFLDVVEENLLG